MPKAKAYNFTIICFNNEDGSRDLTHVENVTGPSFKCPRCGLQLVWVDDNAGKRLSAHGKTKDTIKHELRKVEELR